MIPDFTTKGFYGSVLLKDWYIHRDGGSYRLVTGTISILRDEEVVGFKVQRSESNWVARIVGPTESITILGCQIRGVNTHSRNASFLPGAILVVP